MKRRTFTAMALAVTAGLGLSGCAGAAGTAPQAQDGKTTLTVSVWNYEGTPEFKALFDG